MLSRSIKQFRFSSRRSRHQNQTYSSLQSADHPDPEFDIEKRSSASYDDSDWESDSSSHASPSTPLQKRKRNSSYSQTHGELVFVRPISKDANGRPRRVRRHYSRYFSICLGLTLVVLAVTLWQLSASSARAVQDGFKHLPQDQTKMWESFELLERYYGGLKSLVAETDNKPEWPDRAAEEAELRNLTASSKGASAEEEKTAANRRRRGTSGLTVFDPYPEDSFRSQCFLDGNGVITVPQLSVYNGVVQGMPDPAFGSYDVFGMKKDVCFERFGRLAPYGLGYSQRRGGSGAGMEGDREGTDDVWASADGEKVDWRKVRWVDAQKRCIEKNKHRFKETAQEDRQDPKSPKIESDVEHGNSTERRKAGSPLGHATATLNQRLSRTAVIVRTWHDYEYSIEDLLHLRALIAELAINSGGEYEIHFLVHVRDNDLPIWADAASYASVLNSSLPAEFAGLGTLWSERQMSLIYGGLADSNFRDMSVHGVYRSTFMPLQWFAKQHPEYDNFWQWEMDVRYIGHYYELVHSISKWTKEQPRKGLWERNARFYVPSEHGNWEDFRQMVRVQTEHGTSSSWKENAQAAASGQSDSDWEENVKAHAAKQQGKQKAEKPIWGSESSSLNPSDVFEEFQDPKAPESMADDQYEWGVGEEADLILFNPLFDPSSTTWLYTTDITGYNTTSSSLAASKLPPRRASIGTTGRYSRRLLDLMHRETALAKHHMFSEMWPATTALHHGLKAVYAPHPIYVDRRWPTSLLAAVFNNGRNGASGGSRRSVFSEEQQHNFRGTSWFYDAEFAARLWRRWLGYKADEEGGEQFEVTGEGRMCLPSMLLHPVKGVEMVYEHGEWDEIAEDEERQKEKHGQKLKQMKEGAKAQGKEAQTSENELPEN